MITAETCGKIIAEARKEQNLTQKDVAERLHITDRAVSKWERGLNFPDIGLMQELADVLGITVQRLLGLEENHPSVEETMDAVTVVAKGTEKKGVLIRDLILFDRSSCGGYIFPGRIHHILFADHLRSCWSNAIWKKSSFV